MRAGFAAAGLGLAMLAGCQSAPKPVVAQAADEEPLDPFVVSIGAQRWGVIIDRATQGAIEAPDRLSAAQMESDLYRADAALKSGAAEVIVLRNFVCGKGLLTGEACELKDWPAWTLEPPTADTPIEVIDQRSEWLSIVMSPFAEIGCEAGRAASGDDMFCSVE